MTTQAITALQDIHHQMRSVLTSLSAEQWSAQSGCEGWRVQDVFAHVTSNMKETVEPTPPPAEGAPEMGAEAAMEALVAPRKDWAPEQLLEEYDRYFEGWIGAMGALQEEPMRSTESPLADLGTHPMHLVANAYAFDHYCHLRIDLADVALDLPEATDDMVRPGIDWMIAGMPQMQVAELAVAVSQPLQLNLTGPGGGSWVLGPAGDDGLMTVSEGHDASVAATITSSAHDFVSWGTKRSDWRSACTIDGDADAATAFLDTVNII